MVEAAVGALVAAEVFGGIAAAVEGFAGGGVCLVLGLVAVLLAALESGGVEVMGAAVVGKRVLERGGALDVGILAIGCAQVGPDELAGKALERADQAALDALEQGGGQLLAVALV